MTTATQSSIASIIVPPLRMAMGYAERLVADIPAEKFAHLPAPNINHPAWCIGHLAIYPENVLQLVGRADLAAPDQTFVELFKAGTPCVEEAGRYPAKDVIVKRFRDRWECVANALPGVADERFLAANPMEGRLREMLPTVGAAIVFLCGAHLMLHLGQVSTWRRLIGLGPVM